MSESNFGSEGNEGERPHAAHGARPNWKRMHHSWIFWVGMVLVSVAIAVYVLSDNLALLPRGPRQSTLSDTGGK
jgi:hypothetical protein